MVRGPTDCVTVSTRRRCGLSQKNHYIGRDRAHRRECRCYCFSSAATPGSSIPARNSRDAPPPVDTCVIFPLTPAALIAFSESPPPTIEVAPEPATALASDTVPLSKGGFSKIPIGPFQMTILATEIACEYCSIVLEPISTPILSAGIASTVSFEAPGAMVETTTWSTGNRSLSDRSFTNCLARSSLSSSTSDLPVGWPSG